MQQALAHFEDFEEQQSKLPYINMTSQTNGQRFRLFIEKQEMEQPQYRLVFLLWAEQFNHSAACFNPIKNCYIKICIIINKL